VSDDGYLRCVLKAEYHNYHVLDDYYPGVLARNSIYQPSTCLLLSTLLEPTLLLLDGVFVLSSFQLAPVLPSRTNWLDGLDLFGLLLGPLVSNNMQRKDLASMLHALERDLALSP
jgi:hypothetical protein